MGVGLALRLWQGALSANRRHKAHARTSSESGHCAQKGDGCESSLELGASWLTNDPFRLSVIFHIDHIAMTAFTDCGRTAIAFTEPNKCLPFAQTARMRHVVSAAFHCDT